MSRWKASTIHLAISALIVLSLGAVLSLTWYPPAYVQAVGGLGLIAILVAVDVTIGPLLTLIVWDVKKRSLRFDMAVIAMLQISALSYGLYAIFWARPVYVVFATDRFELVAAADIPEGEQEKAKRQEFKTLPLAGPEIVATRMPDDRDERSDLVFYAMAGLDVPQMPRYYVPYADLAAEAARKARPLDSLTRRNEEAREKLASYLKEKKLDPSRVGFLPLRAKQQDQTVLVNNATGEVLGIVNVDPWL
jgi:hypothetical protein